MALKKGMIVRVMAPANLESATEKPVFIYQMNEYVGQIFRVHHVRNENYVVLEAADFRASNARVGGFIWAERWLSTQDVTLYDILEFERQR